MRCACDWQPRVCSNSALLVSSRGLLFMHGHLLLRRRMWALLQLHSKQCNQADCPVPRCKELRMLKRRQLIRQEEKRRQGYANMLQAQVGCQPQCASS